MDKSLLVDVDGMGMFGHGGGMFLVLDIGHVLIVSTAHSRVADRESGRRSTYRSLRRARNAARFEVQEVPYEDRIVVRAADDLEFVELKPEHPTRMLLKRE